MLEPINLIPFFIAAVVLAFRPRPSILFVMTRTVAGGRVGGFASTLVPGLIELTQELNYVQKK